MFRILSRTLLIAAAFTAAPLRAADPADPLAEVPPLHYRSPLDSGRRDAATPVGDWRAANQAVAGQSGHTHDHAGSAPDPHAEHTAAAAADPHAGHRAAAPAAGAHDHAAPEATPQHCPHHADHHGGHGGHGGHGAMTSGQSADPAKEGGDAHTH